jgi:transposase
MMGRLNRDQGQFLYCFNLEEVVPEDHSVRAIAGVLDLSWVYAELAPYYSRFGRPSIDPALMIRMLIVGYVFGIRSERALCRDVRVNLAYRWFCGLNLEDNIPDHSAFSRARNERFRDGDVFRRVFERVVSACMAAGLVGGEGFAVDASRGEWKCYCRPAEAKNKWPPFDCHLTAPIRQCPPQRGEVITHQSAGLALGAVTAMQRPGRYRSRSGHSWRVLKASLLTHFVISRGSFAVLHKAALNVRLSR